MDDNQLAVDERVEKGVVLATDIFILRILILLFKVLSCKESDERIIVDSSLLKRILSTYPSFLGPLQVESLDKLMMSSVRLPRMSMKEMRDRGF